MIKEYSKYILILIIALFIEVIVFNITSYRLFMGNYEEIVYEEPRFLYNEENKVYLAFENINKKVGTVKINLKDVEEPTEYQIFYSDETTEQYYDLKSKFYINNIDKTQYIPTYLSGETKALIVSIDKDIYNTEKFEGITINKKIPFEFNIIRFAFILAIFIIGYYWKYGKILNSEYSKYNFKQEIILSGIVFVFVLLTSCINSYSTSENDYDNTFWGFISTNSGIYNKEFVDSILDGKFYLLQEPTKTLLEMEDPYDTLTRGKVAVRDKDYIWDTALYNGHQYIYFGILPLLLFFIPFYLLTNKYLKISVVVFIFSIMIFLLLKEILLTIIKKYIKNIPFKIVILSLLTLCSGTLIIYANGISRVYELVIIAGLYFVLQGLYFILKSLECSNYKYLNIFLGALFLALSVACRPTDLLVSLLIVPYLLKLLINNIKQFKENKKDLFKLVIAVGIPYITIGLLLMWYNYIRFENPFEFGANYQLTISNVESLGSRIWAIPVGMLCNLFNMPQFIQQFPFIANNNNLATFYGYYYIEEMLGGLFFIAPICFCIFFIIKANKKIENKELKTLINSLIIVGSIIAVTSVIMAGSNQRYLIDYAWMFILAGILIFINLYNILKSSEAKKILRFILIAITIYTCMMGVLLGIISEKNYIKIFSPEEYYKLKYTICFWE